MIGENVVPEFLQEDCTPGKLADALCAMVQDTENADVRSKRSGRLDEIMRIGGPPPSAKAAAIVLEGCPLWAGSGVSP